MFSPTVAPLGRLARVVGSPIEFDSELEICVREVNACRRSISVDLVLRRRHWQAGAAYELSKPRLEDALSRTTAPPSLEQCPHPFRAGTEVSELVEATPDGGRVEQLPVKPVLENYLELIVRQTNAEIEEHPHRTRYWDSVDLGDIAV